MRRREKPRVQPGVEFRSNGTLRVVGSGWRHYLTMALGFLTLAAAMAAWAFINGVPAPDPPDTSCARPLQSVRDARAADTMRQFAEAEPDTPTVDGWQPETVGRDAAVAILANPDCFAETAVQAARYANRNPDEPGVWSSVLTACPMLREEPADAC